LAEARIKQYRTEEPIDRSQQWLRIIQGDLFETQECVLLVVKSLGSEIMKKR
jgi:hypothetical protein